MKGDFFMKLFVLRGQKDWLDAPAPPAESFIRMPVEYHPACWVDENRLTVGEMV